MRIYTTGTTIAPLAIARMVGNNHHVGQVDVYVSAPTKAAALAALAAADLSPSSARKLHVATGMTTDALAAAGLFAGPNILVTHTAGTGTVVQVTAGQDPAVIGDVTIADRGTTVIGAARYAERSARFVPATPAN